MMKKAKRKKKVAKLDKKKLIENQDYLIERMKQEWLEAERALKKHEIVKKAQIFGKDLTKALLMMGVVGGVLTVAAIAPNMFVAFDRINRHRRFFQKANRDVLYQGRRHGYFKFEQVGENEYRVYVTDKGKLKTLREAINDLRIVKDPASWDGKWRMVIFDIPRKHNAFRDALRDRFKTLGLYPLQESVYICPYPCWKEVDFLAAVFNASDYIHFITADSITSLDSESMESWFGLKI